MKALTDSLDKIFDENPDQDAGFFATRLIHFVAQKPSNKTSSQSLAEVRRFLKKHDIKIETIKHSKYAGALLDFYADLGLVDEAFELAQKSDLVLQRKPTQDEHKSILIWVFQEAMRRSTPENNNLETVSKIWGELSKDLQINDWENLAHSAVLRFSVEYFHPIFVDMLDWRKQRIAYDHFGIDRSIVEDFSRKIVSEPGQANHLLDRLKILTDAGLNINAVIERDRYGKPRHIALAIPHEKDTMYRLMEMGLDLETDITPSFENKDNNNRQTLLSAIEKSGKEDLKRSLEWALLQTSVKDHCDQAVSAKRKTM